MSGIAAFFQAIGERWHDWLFSDVDQRGRFFDSRAPITAPVPGVPHGPRSAFRPLENAGSELRLDRMMEVFGVDRRELEQDYPNVLRDAEITCMRCRLKRRCFRELEAGTAAKNAERFCPNADLFMIFAGGRNDALRGRTGGLRQ